MYQLTFELVHLCFREWLWFGCQPKYCPIDRFGDKKARLADLHTPIHPPLYGKRQIAKIASLFVFFFQMYMYLQSLNQFNTKIDEQIFPVTSNTHIISLAYKHLNI